MTVKCETCEHLRRIRAGGKMAYGELRAACAKCNPDDMPHKGRSHVQATDFTLAQQVVEVRAPTTGCTTLDPDAEDTLRKAMATLFAFDPFDLLLVQHIINGGSLASFDKVFAGLVAKAKKYRGRTGAMAAARKDVICARFPAVAPVLQGLVDAGGGNLVKARGHAAESHQTRENGVTRASSVSAGTIIAHGERRSVGHPCPRG